MFLLDSDLGALLLAHILHTLPETLRPRYISDEELDRAFAVLRTRIENCLVEEVRDVFYLAEPAQVRLSFTFSNLKRQTERIIRVGGDRFSRSLPQ